MSDLEYRPWDHEWADEYDEAHDDAMQEYMEEEYEKGQYDDGRNDIKGEAPTLLDSALDVLWRLSQYIPEMWGDEVKDGYISLYLSADVIDEIERVLYVSEVD